MMLLATCTTGGTPEPGRPERHWPRHVTMAPPGSVCPGRPLSANVTDRIVAVPGDVWLLPTMTPPIPSPPLFEANVTLSMRALPPCTKMAPVLLVATLERDRKSVV